MELQKGMPLHSCIMGVYPLWRYRLAFMSLLVLMTFFLINNTLVFLDNFFYFKISFVVAWSIYIIYLLSLGMRSSSWFEVCMDSENIYFWAAKKGMVSAIPIEDFRVEEFFEVGGDCYYRALVETSSAALAVFNRHQLSDEVVEIVVPISIGGRSGFSKLSFFKRFF